MNETSETKSPVANDVKWPGSNTGFGVVLFPPKISIGRDGLQLIAFGV